MGYNHSNAEELVKKKDSVENEPSSHCLDATVVNDEINDSCVGHTHYSDVCSSKDMRQYDIPDSFNDIIVCTNQWQQSELVLQQL